MTIKDIAREANVSVTTVSKIINGKDANISDETKKRVNDIIKKYNYKPFYNYTVNQESTTNMVAVVMPFSNQFSKMVLELEKNFFNEDYNSSIFTYIDESELNAKLGVINGRKFSGILLFTNDKVKIKDKIFEKIKIPTVLVRDELIKPNNDSFYKNLEQGFYNLLKEVKQDKHSKIGYVYQNENAEKFQLFSKSAVLNGLDETKCYFYDKDNINKFISSGVTVLIAENETCAMECYRYVYKNNLNIPNDISIVSLSSVGIESFVPKLSYIDFYSERSLERFVDLLVKKIEGYKLDNIDYGLSAEVYKDESLCISKEFSKNNHIVVVGTINMDIIKRVNVLPEKNDEVFIKHLEQLAGGKGANQAVGIAKLGGTVSLIGKVGDDTDGHELYRELSKQNIRLEGVKVDSGYITGKAYISISPEGESRMEIFSGANANVTVDYVKDNISCFEEAKYCLVQSEIPVETVNYVLKYSKDMGIKAILRPAIIEKLDEVDVKDLFLLVSNKKEISRLIGEESKIEEQFHCLKKLGIKNSIIVDGNECAYFDGKETVNFKTIDVDVVDETGTLDGFISTLVVFLSKGNSFLDSIEIALNSYAYSRTVMGVQNAMPTIEQLEKFLAVNDLKTCKKL